MSGQMGQVGQVRRVGQVGQVGQCIQPESTHLNPTIEAHRQYPPDQTHPPYPASA